ncbi:MAG: hypothetical protein RIS19_953, partial [Actinomycetota bacterium]
MRAPEVLVSGSPALISLIILSDLKIYELILDKFLGVCYFQSMDEKKLEDYPYGVPTAEILEIYGTKTGEYRTWTDKNGIEHTYRSTVYVDVERSICRQGGMFLCDEHVENGILYRCILCHYEDIDSYCRATTSYGRRCKSKVANLEYNDELDYYRSFRKDPHDNYCHRHAREAVRSGKRFSIDSLDEWLDSWQKETILRWKKDLLERLEILGRLTVLQLEALSKSEPDIYVYFIKCGNYVKIGKSANPKERFKTLKRESDATIRPKDMNIAEAELIGYIPGSGFLEGMLHGHLRGYIPGSGFLEGMLHGHLREEHAAGEWFRLGSKTSKLLETYMGKSDFTVNKVVDSLIRDYDVIIGQNL